MSITLPDLATQTRPISLAKIAAMLEDALSGLALDPAAADHTIARYHADVTVARTLHLLVEGNPDKKRTWLIPPSMRQTERLTVTGMIQWKTQALEKLMRMPVTDVVSTQRQVDMVQRLIYGLELTADTPT